MFFVERLEFICPVIKTEKQIYAFSVSSEAADLKRKPWFGKLKPLTQEKRVYLLYIRSIKIV